MHRSNAGSLLALLTAVLSFNLAAEENPCLAASDSADPACVATGMPQHLVWTLCDYQWIPGVCELVRREEAPYRVDAEPNADQPLFLAVGVHHQHSAYSDGWPESRPADYFKAGRTGHNNPAALQPAKPDDSGVIVDFMMGSEHSDNEKLPITTSAACVSFYSNPNNWREAFEQADHVGLISLLRCAHVEKGDHYYKWEATLLQALQESEIDDNGNFTGFTGMRGFEYTNDYYNHLNVFFSTNVVNVKIDGSLADLQIFWDWLQEPVATGGGQDALVTFNHPGGSPKLSPFDGSLPHGRLMAETKGGANWNDLAYVPEVDAQVVGMEVNGDRHVPWYVKALTNGWHIGPVAAEDIHQTHWSTVKDGKSLMLTRGRSPRDYYWAMKNRRTISLHKDVVAGTPGTRAQVPHIEYFAGGSDLQTGAPLGSIVQGAAGELVTLTVNASGFPDGTSVSLISNTSNGQTSPIALVDDGDGTAAVSFDAAVPADAEEDWYFAMFCPHQANAVCGADNRYYAVTAPIWVRRAD